MYQQDIRLERSRSRYSFEDLLLYALIAVSTIPFFKSTYGVVFIIGCILYRRQYLSNVFKAENAIVLIVVLALEIYHATYFAGYELWVSRQIMLFFVVSAFVVNYLRLNFLSVYMKLMYQITCISFVFFTLLIISPTLTNSIAALIPSFFVKSTDIYGQIYAQANPIIYNFDHNFFKIRNNGPFWEPTVFASLLLIAQIFNYFQNKKFLNKQGVVFTVGIITTFSTTVFIGYFILIIGSLIVDKKIKLFYKVCLLTMTIISGIYLFSYLPFLEEKINEEVANIDSNIDTRGDSRMASAILDLTEITQNQTDLFFGRGSSKDSRIQGIDKHVIRNCGTTALLVEWGIFFFCLYVGLIFYSFYQLCLVHQVSPLFAIICTILILLVSFSEVFLDLPLFHAFIFIGFVARRYRLAAKNSSTIISRDDITTEKPVFSNSSVPVSYQLSSFPSLLPRKI